MIQDELQSSFKQRSEQTIHRKQQELESRLFRRTMDTVQEVDVDSQRVSCKSNANRALGPQPARHSRKNAHSSLLLLCWDLF